MSNSRALIPIGTKVCNSTVGHNNFVYPLAEDCIVVTQDIIVERMSFVGGGDLTAYKVIDTNQIIWTQKENVQNYAEDNE